MPNKYPDSYYPQQPYQAQNQPFGYNQPNQNMYDALYAKYPSFEHVDGWLPDAQAVNDIEKGLRLSEKMETIEISSKDLSPASCCSNIDLLLPDLYKNNTQWYYNNRNYSDYPSCSQITTNFEDKTSKYCSVQSYDCAQYPQQQQQDFDKTEFNYEKPDCSNVFNLLDVFPPQNMQFYSESSSNDSDIVVEESEDDFTQPQQEKNETEIYPKVLNTFMRQDDFTQKTIENYSIPKSSVDSFTLQKNAVDNFAKTAVDNFTLQKSFPPQKIQTDAFAPQKNLLDTFMTDKNVMDSFIADKNVIGKNVMDSFIADKNVIGKNLMDTFIGEKTAIGEVQEKPVETFPHNKNSMGNFTYTNGTVEHFFQSEKSVLEKRQSECYLSVKSDVQQHKRFAHERTETFVPKTKSSNVSLDLENDPLGNFTQKELAPVGQNELLNTIEHNGLLIPVEQNALINRVEQNALLNRVEQNEPLNPVDQNDSEFAFKQGHVLAMNNYRSAHTISNESFQNKPLEFVEREMLAGDILDDRDTDNLTAAFVPKNCTLENAQCTICRIAYSPLEREFYPLTEETPRTIVSDKPVFAKLRDLLEGEWRDENYVCGHCLRIVNMIDHLETKLQTCKSEFYAKINKNGSPDENAALFKKNVNCDYCRRGEIASAPQKCDYCKNGVSNKKKCDYCKKGEFASTDKTCEYCKKGECSNTECKGVEGSCVFCKHYCELLKLNAADKCKNCESLRVEKIAKHKNYLCDICGRTFLRVRTFRIHMKFHRRKIARNKNQIEAFICRICNKLFRTRSNLKEHESYCSGVLNYKCKVCAKKFTTRTKLKNHVRLKHDKKFTSICSICNIGFVKISAYKSHMVSHCSEKKFPCAVCGKFYKTKSNLKFHMKFHEDRLPFNCAVCRKGFMRKEYLESHTATHTGERNFACTSCEKSFISQKNLDAHLKLHDGTVKRKTCNVCGKSISKGMEDHMRTHANLKEFECDACEARFNTKGALFKHKKRKHADDYIES